MKSFEWIGCGRNRTVFRHGNWVIKVPLNDYGFADNDHEHRIFRKYGVEPNPDKVRYARCRMIGQLLVMEHVDETSQRDALPEWASYIGGNQVGLNRSGKWVAFDYGRF